MTRSSAFWLAFVCLTVLAAGLAPAPAGAMPLASDVLARIQALPPAARAPLLSTPDWVDRPPLRSRGTRVEQAAAVVLLVDFEDNPADPSHPPSAYQDLLFTRGGVPTGSMIDYYDTVSYGQFTLIGEVHLAWLRLPQTYAYYVNGQRGFGAYPQNARKMVEDAIAAADPLVDFSQFDGDGDGAVDALFVVHAGPGYEETGNVNMIHSHMSWGLGWETADGVAVDLYSVEPEERANGSMITVGVFCHEFGHVLGLPDLYDYDYDAEGVGNWCLMAGGSWGGDGGHPERPVQMLAWCKNLLGWLDPEVVTSGAEDVVLADVESHPRALRLGASGPEYFLAENRQLIGWDADLPAAGLIITHIDEAAANNDNQCCGSGPVHNLVAIEQADGECDLESNRNRGDDGDPFPGSTGNTVFDTASNPNSWNYGGAPTWVALTDIRAQAPASIILDVTLAPTAPYLAFGSVALDDGAGGDGDGWPESGESVELSVSVANYGLPVAGVAATLSTASALATITDATAAYGDFATLEEKTAGADTFGLTVAAGVPRGSRIELALDLTGSGGYATQIVFALILAPLPLTTSPTWSAGSYGYTTALALGDLNGDGRMDLARGGVFEQLGIHYGGADGFESEPSWWASDSASDYPSRVMLVDLAGDGRPELVAANTSIDLETFEFLPARVKLYGNDSGTPATANTWRSSARHAAMGAAAGDLTGDGIPDLYLACALEPDVLYAGRADQTFDEPPVWTAAAAHDHSSVVLGDLDGDGDLDVVAGGSDGIRVYHNQGGVLPAMPDWESTPSYEVLSLDLGDVDGDGDLDLAIGCWSGRARLLAGQDGSFLETELWQSDETATTFHIFLEDLDLDGLPELLTANVSLAGQMPGAQDNRIYANDGGQLTTYAAWVSDHAGATVGATTGDAEGDGDVDFLVADLAAPIGQHENVLDLAGCRLRMPARHFTVGDPCGLTAVWYNPGAAAAQVPAFVILEVYGAFYFAPSWSLYLPPDPAGVDFYLLDPLPRGATEMQVIPEFAWPAGAGSASGLRFYGAMLNEAGDGLRGELDIWEFGFDS